MPRNRPPASPPSDGRSYFRLAPLNPSGQLESPPWAAWRPLHSWTPKYINILFAHADGSNASELDTGGTLRTILDPQVPLNSSAAAGDAAFGIVLGHGTMPVAANYNALGDQWLEGENPLQAAYQVSEKDALLNGQDSASFLLKRRVNTMPNPTASITEMGLYCQLNTFNFIMLYDVIDPAIELSNSIDFLAQYFIASLQPR